MDVYNSLGYGFLEVVYKDAMEIDFFENNMPYQREKEFSIMYREKLLKRSFNTDFFLFDKIVVEVKAKTEGIPDEAIAQTINYLKASGTNVGLIVNFGKSRLDYKRLVF